jgi:hypothetical protein
MRCSLGLNENDTLKHRFSSTFKEQNRDLAQIEVDEVFGLVSHIGAVISANDAMPAEEDQD